MAKEDFNSEINNAKRLHTLPFQSLFIYYVEYLFTIKSSKVTFSDLDKLEDFKIEITKYYIDKINN